MHMHHASGSGFTTDPTVSPPSSHNKAQ